MLEWAQLFFRTAEQTLALVALALAAAVLLVVVAAVGLAVVAVVSEGGRGRRAAETLPELRRLVATLIRSRDLAGSRLDPPDPCK